MKLEDQVVNLELSSKLKALGVKQNAIFNWILAEHPAEKCGSPMIQLKYDDDENYNITHVHEGWTLTSYSAFTVAELGEILPGGMIQTETCNRNDNVKKYMILLSGSRHHVIDDNEANARARMIIYLIENKLIEVE